jgi:hypothetical protein
MSIATQRVMWRSLGPPFCNRPQNTRKYLKMSGLLGISGKIGGQKAFERFSPIEPTNYVYAQLTIAKIRLNGIFCRFNRFAPIPRLPNTDPPGEA